MDSGTHSSHGMIARPDAPGRPTRTSRKLVPWKPRLDPEGGRDAIDCSPHVVARPRTNGQGENLGARLRDGKRQVPRLGRAVPFRQAVEPESSVGAVAIDVSESDTQR